MKTYKKVLKKGLSFVLSFNLLLQSFVPFIITPVYATDSTPSAETIVASPTPDVTPEATPTPTEEITPTPTEEVTPTPTAELTPEVTPTPTEEIIPTPTEEVTPTPTSEPTPVITPEETPTPTIEVTPTIEITPTTEPEVTPEPSSNTDSQAPPADQPSNSAPETTTTTVPESITIASNLEQALTPEPTLSTDKSDYFPTEIVHISGTGFLANTTYTLHITSSDMPFVSYKVEVTTDENGSLSYAYQLDGHYRPNYTIDALDASGKIVASVKFTDPVSVTWPTTWNNYLVNGLPIFDDEKHGSNDDPSNGGTGVSPSSIDIASGSIYAGTDPGNQPSVQYLTSDATYLFYRMRLAAEPLTSGGASRHWDILLDTDHDGYKEYVIDLDHNANTFGLYFNDTDVNTYDPTTDATSFLITSAETSGYVRQVLETYGTASSADDQYYLDFAIPKSEFGSAIDDAIAANLFYSTSASNTDPLQKDWMGFSGFIFGITKSVSTDGTGFASSQTVTAGTDVYFKVTLTNTGNANLTNVSIVDTLPAGFIYVTGSSSGVTTGNPTISSQTLTWAGPFTVNAGGSISLTFRATTPSVSSQTTFTNTASGYVSSDLLGSATAQVVVNPGTGTLTVQKTTYPSGDTTSFPISATSSTGGTITGGGAGSVTDANDHIYTVTAGTYSVTESAPLGWVETSNTCTNVVVAAAGTASCLITNTKNASITLSKSVTKNNGGTAGVNDFGLTIGVVAVNSGETKTLSPNTSYAINEVGLAGYSFVSITGDAKCPSILGGSISLEPGDNVSCTITNDDNVPSLTLIKSVNNDNNGNAAATDWTLTATGPTTISGTGGVASGSTFSAGTYTLSESAGPSGYTPGSWSCVKNTLAPVTGSSITLGLGDTATCTVINDDNAPQLTVVKNVVNDNGGSANVGDFGIKFNDIGLTFGAGVPAGSTTAYSSTPTVLANTVYTLSESDFSGYTEGSWSCIDDGTGLQVSHPLTLNEGQSVTCTITNDDNASHLVVHKTTYPVGDTTEFSILASGTGTVSDAGVGKITDVADKTFEVTPGTYSVTESETPGWKETLNTCNGIEVKLGETKECTITNEKYGSISGHKYQVNANSSLAGPISGWTIYLTQGTTTVSTTTDSNGYFIFSNLLHGIYALSEETRSDYTPIYSPADVTLDYGDNISDSDFGNFLNGSIFGVKFEDKNGNGVINDEDGYLSGWKIFIDENGDGLWDEGETFTITDASGYSLSNLGPGTYSVCEVEKAGWGRTYPTDSNCQSITVSSSSTHYNANFGNQMRGSITIVKDAVPNSTADFAFTSPQLGGFSLDDDTNALLSNTKTFTNLGSNTYTITESTKAGWKLTDLICTGDSDATVNLTTRTASLTINNPDESITCTFTNTKYGAISGYKFNDINGNGIKETDDIYLDGWNIRLYDSSLSQKATKITGAGNLVLGKYNFGNLLPGTYFVCEDIQANWAQTYPSSGTFNNNGYCHEIVLNAGQTSVNNNFGNFQKAKIVVHKNVLGTDGISDPADNTAFTAYLDGTNSKTISENTTATYDNLFPDTYTISEGTPPSGYSWVSTSGGGSVTVTSGGTHDVYITNKQDSATLTVIKHVVDDNGGNAVAGNFTMNVTGTNVSDPSFPGEETGTTITLDAGSYSVDEDYFPGYEKSLSTDCRGTISFGETKTCTITNDDIAPKLTLVKDPTNDNGGNALPDDFQLTVGGTSVLSGSKNTYLANTPYTISETQLDGYAFDSITGDAKCPAVLGGTATLDEGDDITCTIINDDVSPSITLNKVVLGGSAAISDFSLYIGGNPVSSGQKLLVDANKPYSLDEDGPPGYSFTSITGDAKCPAVLGGTVTLDEDEDIICTITNTRDTGTIVVNKVIDIDGDLSTPGDQSAGGNWQFDVGGTGTDTTDAAAQYTSTLGSATYSNLKTGQYSIIETTQSGYDLFSATCGTGNGTFDQIDGMEGVTVSNGETTTCTFYNTPNGTIHGYKWSDNNMNGELDDENLLPGWTINLYDWNAELRGFNTTPIKTMVTDDGEAHYGWYWFEHLFPGRYKVCEVPQTGWSQTFPASCHMMSLPYGNSNDFEFTRNATYGPEYNFGNVELARLTVYKFQDDNQDGYFDGGDEGSEKLLSGWEIKLGQVEGTTSAQTTGTDGSTTFENIMPGSYNLSETIKDGWFQSRIYCPNEEAESSENSLDLRVGAGDEIVCYIGNYTNPELQISKSNNAVTDKTPGESVVYRIFLRVINSDINDLVVTDLLPKDIVYRIGSYQVKINGLIIPISEPTYNSPGIWNIGDVKVGDEIELLYTADISADKRPGTYKDLAFAMGTSLADEEVLALAQTEGYIDINYVGTSVNIVKDQTDSGDYNVEKKVEGQVLGASTDLPATGANEMWLLIAVLSLYFGLKLVSSSKAK